MKKNILSLDLGTNSIGWALLQQNFEEKYGKILGLGSRIIPMAQDAIDNFNVGIAKSQTAERTKFRSVRRLRERHLLRRERLHRVLNVLGFLPVHYAQQIDFDRRLGKFLPETETKFAYVNGQFLFKKSFEEMISDFIKHQPDLVADDKKVPHDWTIYYLRKKALTNKIENEELAWLLLHFNQKRGYYQRNDETSDKASKSEEFHTLKVIEVTADEQQKGKPEIWYNIILENGWVYRRASKLPLLDWKGKNRNFIVTTELDDNGEVKKGKDGSEKRSFRSPKDDDWQLLKKKTEFEVRKSNKTVGEFIYDSLLESPGQKIKGELVRTIEREFYKEELEKILIKQVELNADLRDSNLYQQCIEELYPNNFNHQASLEKKDFIYLFVEDILFYQRPLRSQKGSISNCSLESRTYIYEGVKKTDPLKCIAKSHPLYQEFRLWQWITNLRIFSRENDVDETDKCLKSVLQKCDLFDFLNSRKEIDQKGLLKHLKLKEANYRWNYVEDKKYPCNETYTMIASRLEKISGIPEGFLTKEKEQALWHIIYSVTDKVDYEKALKSFAIKNEIDVESFVDSFKKFPPFASQYGAYSEKAIKKILPLLRMGNYWSEGNIDSNTAIRIDKIINGEYDENIRTEIRDKAIMLSNVSSFQGLPEWLAKYIVYDRHSERSDNHKWKSVGDLELYLKSFRQHSLRNPIVEQVITETLRVVKDIWTQYGNGAEQFFTEIHIELGREMKNPKDKRKRLTEQGLKNEQTNLRIKALLAEMLNDVNVENVRPYSPMQQDILKIYEDGVLNDAIEIPEDILKISKMAVPKTSELQRYKLWLEQKYRSPYTGEVIPLNKLFTPAYEIEHVIPQSRYFDDSFSNKVICESAINKLKDNKTGLQFIQDHHGQIVQLGMGKKATVFTEEAYTAFVKQHYANSYSKKSKLLSLDVPEKMIERQLNDTRYISKYVMQLLSNIVRSDEGDDGVNSKNVLATNGQITAKLKQDWGLDAVWNELILPRFERLNAIKNSTNFTAYNERYQKYIPVVPLELQEGFQKKRIDHRHHALDALVIACATRSHINYLNNQNAIAPKTSKDIKQKGRDDLKTLLCEKKYNSESAENYNWVFKQPWETFVLDAKAALDSVVVSFKQNLRIINKTNNKYEKIIDGKKIKVKQIKGDNWAIRKSLHKDTVSGSISLQKEKLISLSTALDNIDDIVNKELKNHIKELCSKGYNKTTLLKHFKDNGNQFRELSISKVMVYYWDNDNVASRTSLDDSFNDAAIENITDTGIQKILKRHLHSAQNGGNPEIAFSSEGVEDMNKNITVLNDGKFHQPIKKVRKFEVKGNKFQVGHLGSKSSKYVEAAKGTNLFFAIYIDGSGRRNYETVPLNEVVAHQQQRATMSKNEREMTPLIPINNVKGKLLFYLSPGDLVYVPDEEDLLGMKNDILLDGEKKCRLYRFVSCTGSEAHFVQNNYSVGIINNEQGTNNKSERMLDFKKSQAFLDEKGKPQMIKSVCWKVEIDRLGIIRAFTR